MEYKSLIIGHITMDTNVECTGETTHCAGGAVLYSSAAAYGMGHNVAALTKVATNDMDRLQDFTLPSENVFVIRSKKSTDMYNKYLTPDKERRESVSTSQGDPFTMTDIPNIRVNIYHLAGLLNGDFDISMIKGLSKRGKLAVDMQSFLRYRSAVDGKMYFQDWEHKKQLFRYIDFLKVDAYEAEILTGKTDRKEAAELLYAWGAREILITHNQEVMVFDGERFYCCPIKARSLVGRTGRGDTTFAIYINERLSNNICKSLLTATAAVSYKMEKAGVFSGTREDVEQYIKDFYSLGSYFTMVTAHGGSLKTERNSQKYFDTIKDYNVDIIEVDIQKKGKKLYLNHMPKLFNVKKCLPLSYAFEFIKAHNFKINCDVKRKGIVKDVLKLAKQMDVLDRIIFTGSVSRRDFPHLKEGMAYLNRGFFKFIKINAKNMQKIKDKIESYNNPRIVGVNFRYTLLTDEILAECERIKLPVSTFTVDSTKQLKMLCNATFLDNITTNKPDEAMEIIKGVNL